MVLWLVWAIVILALIALSWVVTAMLDHKSATAWGSASRGSVAVKPSGSS
ncbi:MAG: hypothetical protein ACJ77A_19060 [Actinomycetota bacterium]